MPDRIAIASALIARCEGCRLAPYTGVDGLVAIGFGNRYGLGGVAVTMATEPLRPGQAQALLSDTLLRGTVPDLALHVGVPLQPWEWGALISLAYNIGNAALGASTLLRAINRGEITAAADRFGDFVHVKGRVVHGLVVRRALERAVYLGRVDPLLFTPTPIPSVPHPVFASPRTTTLTADELNARELAALHPIATGIGAA